MKEKILILILTMGALVFMGPLNLAVFSDDHEQLATFFNNCIVKEIVKCESKMALLSASKSKNLQDYARTKAKKAEFLNAEKKMLVDEMIEMQIEPKQYKIELFLNRRYQQRARH
ncbi:MAG: hypothetical protein PVH37_01265 [Desulfobacterales bacterium]|jgi:hypothetical protein